MSLKTEQFRHDRVKPPDPTRIILRWGVTVFTLLLFLCPGGCSDRVPSSGLLERYQLVLGPIVVAGVEANLSGITYSAQTDTLFAIQNNPTVIVEINKSGTVQRTVDLVGFKDTEDLVWVEGERFAIIEERRNTLVFVNIGPRTTVIDYSDTKPLLLCAEKGDNQGLEGIAYDPQGVRFFIVKEKQPQKLYQVMFPDGVSSACQVSTPWKIGEVLPGMKDLAGAHYDSRTGHLFLLSQESGCLVEYSINGMELSRLLFQAGRVGLTNTIPQAEGVAMDDGGNLYICSEPNLIYVFSKFAQFAGSR